MDVVFLLFSFILFATFGKQEEGLEGCSNIILIIWNQGVTRVHLKVLSGAWVLR